MHQGYTLIPDNPDNADNFEVGMNIEGLGRVVSVARQDYGLIRVDPNWEPGKRYFYDNSAIYNYYCYVVKRTMRFLNFLDEQGRNV